MDNMLDKSYGVKFDFEVKTDTRAFDTVEAAANRAGIKQDSIPDRPKGSQAIARAIGFLMRVCAASIEFPAWSKHAKWTERRPAYRMEAGQQVIRAWRDEVCEGRNPNYSLKITLVKQMHTDASQTWRINIANRNKAGENMGHVISVTYDSASGLSFTPGTDDAAHAAFGRELQEIVNAEFTRFATNYNDEDIRKILDAELTDMRALKIIKKTNCFIPRVSMERAKGLYSFAKECGQVVSWLGLDASDMTRDSLLADLRTSIMADMDEYEATLDAKLNTPTGERKRGDKQRERMFCTAIENIDSIMAMAEYHAQVLGVMAEGIIERRNALKTKAHEFLTRDFDNLNVAKTPIVEKVAKEMGLPVTHLEAAFE